MVIDVNNDNIDEVLNEKLTLLQFSADWCGPCRSLTPKVLEISESNSDVAVGKVNVESAGEIASKFKIRNIPVLIYFKDGVEVSRVVGNTGIGDIQSQIDELKK